MDRDTLAAATYEAGRRLNRLKARHGLTSQERAAETDARIERAVALMAHIDGLIETHSPETIQRKLLPFKDQIDRANTSTVCEKEELDTPVGRLPFNVWELAKIGASEVWNALRR
jgi:hypothetical protein